MEREWLHVNRATGMSKVLLLRKELCNIHVLPKWVRFSLIVSGFKKNPLGTFRQRNLYFPPPQILLVLVDPATHPTFLKYPIHFIDRQAIHWSWIVASDRLVRARFITLSRVSAEILSFHSLLSDPSKKLANSCQSTESLLLLRLHRWQKIIIIIHERHCKWSQ